MYFIHNFIIMYRLAHVWCQVQSYIENTPVLTQDTLLFSSLAYLQTLPWQCHWLLSFLALFNVSMEQAGVVICLVTNLLN